MTRQFLMLGVPAVAVVLVASVLLTCESSTSDPCTGVGCSSRGFCVADQGQAYCACIAGYHPVLLACEPNDPANPCLGIDCFGHGTCRIAADGPTCDCADGYRTLAGGACTDRECDLVCVPIPPRDGGPCVPEGAERCDGRDNDCDGLTDEDFDLDFDNVNCGACGLACGNASHGTGRCELGDCEMICEPGWSNLDGNPANGCEAVCEPDPGHAESDCNGRDDDCDGTTDEGWLTADTCGFGLCRRSSICHDGAVLCRPRTPPAATDGTCDGVDDDCDGLTDEDCTGPDADADADADADTDADADADVDDGDVEIEPICGNGTVEGTEECDDSNDIPLDGCEVDCRFSCHAPSDCSDGDQCTTDSCAPGGTGQVCTNPITAGVGCNDANECTTGETCDGSGACAGGTNTCTCTTVADCVPYEDGNPCNGTLICDTGGHVCVVDPATVVTCDASRDTACEYNECNPSTGTCGMVNERDGAPCNDGLFCTAVDTCSSGTCVGAGNPCSAGDCMGACDESADRCPALPSGTVCRAAAGTCDVREVCDGTSPDCPADGRVDSGTVCRASAGPCDVAESCDGVSLWCPGDGFQSGTLCRAAAGPCDADDYCSGTSAGCPDAFQPSSTECRPSAGPCDLAENCTGTSASCPTNGFSSGTVCRVSAGVCDIAENCTGTSASCPANGYLPSTTVCLAVAGDCDVAETCSGSSATCPADAFRPATYECRPAARPWCDAAEFCTGSSADCPEDMRMPDGSPCDDGQSCTGPDTCSLHSMWCSGPLVGGAETLCNDLDDDGDTCIDEGLTKCRDCAGTMVCPGASGWVSCGMIEEYGRCICSSSGGWTSCGSCIEPACLIPI